MTETVIMPSGGRARRSRTFIPPLLLIPFVLYNILAFTLFGGQPAGWAGQLFQIRMVSGTEWSLTWGDLMRVVGLVCLFFPFFPPLFSSALLIPGCPGTRQSIPVAGYDAFLEFRKG